jgi:nucleotide-binding universal stress UspA family protein
VSFTIKDAKETIMLHAHNLLCSLELSSVSPSVASWAELIAQQFGAELHVLHVVPGLEFMGLAFSSEAMAARDFPLTIEKTRPRVEDFCAKHFQSVAPVVIGVVGGNPAREIVKYVEENGIDLIVMGTHSQAGMDRYLFGSVADKVTRTSTVPVVTVPPPIK